MARDRRMRGWMATFLVGAAACADGGQGPTAGGDGSGADSGAAFVFADVGAPQDAPAATEPDAATVPDESGAAPEPSEPDVALVEETPPPVEPGPCVPSCEKKECGTDGCGGGCGTCGTAEICNGVGTCDPDPAAGCEGLSLAESWVGEFDGDAFFEVLGIPLEAGTDGDLSFKIQCFNSKFIVNGEMNGVASDNVFTLKLSGTYNPQTQALKAKVVDGVVGVFQILHEFTFEGDWTGTLGADGKFTGPWEVWAVSAKGPLGPIDPANYKAGADGTWVAWPGP